MNSVGIVGGGISGLYVAYRLLLRGVKNITIYEKDRIGGRIHTVTVPDDEQTTIEFGAGRISTTHKRVLRLARKFKLRIQLYDKLVVDYYRNGVLKDGEIIRRKLLEACNKLRRRNREFLMSRTLKVALLDVVTASEIDDMQACFGYDLEFESVNAWHALHTMRHDIGPEINFCGIVGGYRKLYDALYDYCTKRGVLFQMTEVLSFSRGTPHVLTTKHGQNKHKIVFFCVTKSDLQKLDVAKHDANLAESLRVLRESPLIRIYTRCAGIKQAFPRRTSTNTLLRQILPMRDPDLAMICYSDTDSATQWAEWQRANVLEQELRRYLRIATGFHFLPKWITAKYWKCGVHGWSPYPVQYKRTHRDFFVCGENVAWHHHAWVEGALASVDEVFTEFF